MIFINLNVILNYSTTQHNLNVTLYIYITPNEQGISKLLLLRAREVEMSFQDVVLPPSRDYTIFHEFCGRGLTLKHNHKPCG